MSVTYTARAGPAGGAGSPNLSCSEGFFRGSLTRLQESRVEMMGDKGVEITLWDTGALGLPNELGYCWQLVEHAGLPNFL